MNTQRAVPKSANGQANGHANGNSAQDDKQDNQIQKSTLAYDPAPHSEEYEFMGPPGALGISVLVPFFTYFFALGCDERGCPPTPVIPFFEQGFRAALTYDFWSSLWDTKAMAVYLAWYAWIVIAWATIPGPWVEGSKLRNGEKLFYKINGEQNYCAIIDEAHKDTADSMSCHRSGLRTFWATAILAGVLSLQYGKAPFVFVYDHWTGLVTASLVMSFVQVLLTS